MIFVPKHTSTSPRRHHSLSLVSCFLFIHVIATIHKTAGFFAKRLLNPFFSLDRFTLPLFVREAMTKQGSS